MTGRWSLDDEHPHPGAPEGLIRPYLVTGGRTRTATPHLALEALLSTVEGAHPGLTASPEGRRIIDMCTESPHSVVDLSAALALPVGVIRVLVGDLVVQGAVVVHDAPPTDVHLVRRLISGVRAL